MKISPVLEIKARLSTYIKVCHNEPVVIPQNGRTVVALIAVWEENLDSLLFANNPRFNQFLTNLAWLVDEKFEDDQEGVIDISQLIDFKGIFEPLQDLEYFKAVKVNPEWGTIYWDNGADLDPDVLYAHITGKAIPKASIQ